MNGNRNALTARQSGTRCTGTWGLSSPYVGKEVLDGPEVSGQKLPRSGEVSQNAVLHKGPRMLSLVGWIAVTTKHNSSVDQAGAKPKQACTPMQT